MYMLFLDYDDVTLDFVEDEIRRLRARAMQVWMKDLGKAVILESSKEHYHVIFPESRLTWGELDVLLGESNAHSGFIKFSRLIGEQALRVSSKPVSKVGEPKIVKIVE